MEDQFGRTIKVGDLFIYGYNWHKTYITIVTKIHKTSVGIGFLGRHYGSTEKVLLKTRANKPHSGFIANELKTSKFLEPTITKLQNLSGLTINEPVYELFKNTLATETDSFEDIA